VQYKPFSNGNQIPMGVVLEVTLIMRRIVGAKCDSQHCAMVQLNSSNVKE
jgi:hypothetical protein